MESDKKTWDLGKTAGGTLVKYPNGCMGIQGMGCFVPNHHESVTIPKDFVTAVREVMDLIDQATKDWDRETVNGREVRKQDAVDGANKLIWSHACGIHTWIWNKSNVTRDEELFTSKRTVCAWCGKGI